jgi:hypothetical protein
MERRNVKKKEIKQESESQAPYISLHVTEVCGQWIQSAAELTIRLRLQREGGTHSRKSIYLEFDRIRPIKLVVLVTTSPRNYQRSTSGYSWIPLKGGTFFIQNEGCGRNRIDTGRNLFLNTTKLNIQNISQIYRVPENVMNIKIKTLDTHSQYTIIMNILNKTLCFSGK